MKARKNFRSLQSELPLQPNLTKPNATRTGDNVGKSLLHVKDLMQPSSPKTHIHEFNNRLLSINDPQQRIHFEAQWMDSVSVQLEVGLHYIGIRKGLLLMAGKAIQKSGEFEAWVAAMFPLLKLRTGRFHMAKAERFLREVEPQFKSDGDAANYSALVDKWTLLKIVQYFKQRLKN